MAAAETLLKVEGLRVEFSTRRGVATVLNGADFHLEDAGEAADGTQLIAVYRRERRSTRNTTTDSSSTTNPNKKEQ